MWIVDKILKIYNPYKKSEEENFMFLRGKEEEKNNKLIEWGYRKLFDNVYCIYITSHYDCKTILKKVEEINNKKIILKINLNIKDYLEFYVFNKDFKEGTEEYLLSLCALDEDEPISDEVDILDEYDFKRFVGMMDLINDTTTILEEEKENISIKAKGRELLETLDNLVIDNDVINKPNHYQLNIKGNNIEVIDIIDEVVKDYTPQQAFKVANILKYILRASKKNGLEDFKKAKKYTEMLLELEE